jgi:hypothetical protein
MSELSNLAAALSAAQSEIEGAVKGAVNPHFRSKYADLGACWDACRGPLTKHGLSIVQLPVACDPGWVKLRTILMHKSGEVLEDTWSVPVSKQDAQGYGSALTYARRYMLQAIVGLAPIDDDAEASVGRSQPQQQQAKQDTHTVEAINALEGVDELSAAYKAMTSSDRMLYASVFKARKEQLSNLANSQAS